jgi:CRP/FNR family transcriptional regulator, dissimilatory nitrate respiration regulator
MIRIMFSDEPALAEFSHELLRAARPMQRAAGAALFRTGQRPAWMYYVRAGEALMQRVTPDGATVVLQRARRGFIAEASLASTRYHCDGVCRTPCDLLAFPLPALREAIDSDPGTRWAWIGLLSAQARLQRARIERQSLKTIRQRLEHLILAEGSATDGYPLPGTRIQLAAELGVTPEALYRCLAALQAEGTLTVTAGRLAWHPPKP